MTLTRYPQGPENHDPINVPPASTSDLYTKTAFPPAMAYARYLSILTVILLLAISIPTGTGAGERDVGYIAHPGRIPRFHDFRTPQLIPGEEGYLNFKIENRYDGAITDIELTIEIYLYANIHESKSLDRVTRPPVFSDTGGAHRIRDTEPILQNESVADFGNSFLIKTRGSTEQGTYFVRLMLNFTYEGEGYTMKSRGHFTREEWEEATTNTTKNDPGNINITRLGVDGIIPDTTFGVKKPWPVWPLYLLGGLSVLFAALAILTYMYEENTNPRFTRWVHKHQRRLGEYRALIIHEAGKYRKRGT